MDRYEIKCTGKQTKKAFKLGAPLQELKASIIKVDEKLFQNVICINDRYYYLPTAEQMLGWLRSKNIKFHFDDETNYWNIGDANDDITPLRWYGYSGNKELDAIDSALEYLSNFKLL